MIMHGTVLSLETPAPQNVTKQRYSTSNNGVFLKSGLGVIEVAENGTIRLIIYDLPSD